MGNQSSRILAGGLLILVSISCVTINIGQQSAAPVNSNDSIQMTLQAIQGSWNQGNNPTALPTSSGYVSSNNYYATPTGDNYSPPPPQDSSSANQLQQTPCLLLGKVRDITVADGYQMDPGSTANKTWELTNGGTCSWDANFQIIDAGGNLPKSVKSKTIGKSVGPGGTVQVTVPVVAPSQAGTYTAYYKMRSSNGSSFGSGTDANSAFWVKITVPGQPVQPPQDDPTSLVLNVSYTNSVQTYTNKTCPHKITLSAVVTPNKNISEIFYFYCSETKTKYIIIGQGKMTANQSNPVSISITLENSAKRTFLLCNDTVQRCYGPGISVNLGCQQKFAITSVQWSKSKYTVYSSTSTFSVAPSLSITSNGAGYVDYKLGTTGSSFSSCTSRVWQGRIQFNSAQTQLLGLTSVGFPGPCTGQVYFYATYPDGTEKTWYVPLEAVKN